MLKKRILQICPHDVTPFSGLCARYQQAAAQLGADVTTVFLSPAHSAPLAHAEYLQCTDLADTKGLRRALHGYASEPWDLVLCHRYRSYRAVVRTPLAANHCIVVAHEYGLMDRWQRRLNRSLFAADMTFAGVSAGVAEELMAGEPVVLPNVVDVEQARQQLLSRQDALAVLGLEPGGFTIGVVGRLHYKKRPSLALQAFQAFAGNHANARLVFLGEGEERVELEREVASNIHILGNVADASKLFNAFDALLHTTRIEAFGMVVLEALFAGVPVVTLHQGGPAYVLDELGVYASTDSVQGFADALHRAQVLDRAELARAGLARVQQHFSIAALATALQKLLPGQHPGG